MGGPTNLSPWPASRTGVVVAGALMVAAGTGAAGDASLSADPWVAYIGNQSRQAPWAGWVRGVGLRTTGLGLLEPGAKDLSSIDAGLREFLDAAQKVLIKADVMAPVGGLNSARRQEVVDQYMAFIEHDQARMWKTIAKRQAEAIAGRATAHELVWQIGNEINSKHYSLSMRTWTERGDRAPFTGLTKFVPPKPGASRQRRYGGSRNDQNYLPLYVEYYLAPTIEGIHDASRAVFGHADRVRIALGSLANARAPAAHAWLDALLGYRIGGDFAPDLKGRRVFELVDIITLHYLMSYPGDDWRQRLERVSSTWLGRGRVGAVWCTEEMGRRRGLRDLGGAIGLRVAFRGLDWAVSKAASSREFRLNFYGSALGVHGSRTGDAMARVHAFLGAGRVRSWSRDDFDLNADLEAYVWEPEEGGKLALVAFPAGGVRQAAFDAISLPIGDGARYDAHGVVYAAAGPREVEFRPMQTQRGRLSLVPERALSVDDESTLVVFLDRSRP